MVADSLLAGIAAHGAPPPLEQRIRGEFGPEGAARDYDKLLRERVAVGDDGLPALTNRSSASGRTVTPRRSFPATPPWTPTTHWRFRCARRRSLRRVRVTLSVPMLRAARSTLLLATGAGKAEALAAVLAGPNPAVPASLLEGERLQVIADTAAHPPAPAA